MSFEAVYRLLADISGYSALVPIGCALFKIRELNSVSKILLAYLLISLAAEIAFSVFMERKLPTKPIENIFCLAEFVLISAIYYKMLAFSLAVRRVFIGCIVLISGIYTIELTQYSTNGFQPSYMTLFILLSVLFFINSAQLIVPETQKITSHYFFWYNSAFFYFFGSSLALFAFRDFIINSGPILSKTLWLIHLMNNIVYYAILTYGIWKVRRV